MLYIIIALAIMSSFIIRAVCAYRDEEDDYAFYPFVGVVGFLMVVGGLLMYGAEQHDDYLSYKYAENPVQTQAIEVLPFETYNTTENVYIVKGKDSQNNARYYYCTKTEDGYQEKFVDSKSVSFEYIADGEQPHLKCYSDTRYRVLNKKPSVWFNFFGWLEYKDFEVGDIYDTWGEDNVKYVFCVPKGSLREKETNHGTD